MQRLVGMRPPGSMLLLLDDFTPNPSPCYLETDRSRGRPDTKSLSVPHFAFLLRPAALVISIGRTALIIQR